MTTLTNPGFPNLANILARMNPDGSIRPLIEVLGKKLDFLPDIPWIECETDVGQPISYRTGIPSPQWRRLNQGVNKTRTNSATFMETCGQIADRAEVDKDQPGNLAQFRMSEEAGKIETMTQEFARALFYESTLDNADRIHGLTPRYGGTTGYTASAYVTKGTNAGTNAHSIWLISWEPGKVYGIYPKGSKAGLSREDLGLGDCFDADGKPFRGYRTVLEWNCGIAVGDYRYTSRHQWDPDDADYADGAKGMYLKMQSMLTKVFALSPNARFYMNRTSFDKLLTQLSSNNVDFLKYVMLGSQLLPTFLGIPIRLTDALVAETAIS